MRKVERIPSALLAFALVLGLESSAAAEPFSYGGRLTEANGKPLEGTFDLTLSFHTLAVGGSQIGAPIAFPGVAMSSGMFQVDLDTKLSATQLRALFADPSVPVWVQVSVGATAYARQRFGVVPYALKVPIDNLTLGYDLQGRLQLNTTDEGQAGYVLSTDGAGILSWIDISGLGGGGGAEVENQIVNGEATKAPAQDAVFDALTARDTAIAGKEPTVTPGTVSQFYRGDKSWQAVTGDAVADGVTDLAPTQNAVFDALATRDTAISGKENAFAAGTTAEFLRGDKTWQAVVQDSITDGATAIAPSQNAVFDALAAKEDVVTPGTSAQFYRGDKTWQTLDTAVVPENGNLYFTAARAKTAAVADQINDGVADVAASQNAVFDALATRDSAISGKENAFGAGTTAQYLRGDKTWQTLNTAGVPESGSLYFTNARAQAAAVADSITDAVTNVAPSQNAVFDALALKQDAFGAGTTLQYLRGDQSWQTLDTTAVAEGTNLYYTDARAKAAAVADSTTDGVTDVAASQNAVFDGLALKQSLTQKNAANGYAGLDAGGKILPANLPYAGLAFKGTWDAGTNTPTLTSGACGTSGDYYITAAGGATNLNGITTWGLGDWAICGTGNVWTRVGNPSGSGITTVNGLTGATINLITDNINEGSTNLYFSNARAKSAAVANAIADGVNDVAPSQNAVFDALALKEGSLTAGTTAQYFRGDKTWQTLNTAGVPESGSLYFTNARAQSAAVADQIVDATTNVAPSQNAVFDALAGKEPSITAGTTSQYFRGDKTWQTLNTTNVAEGTGLYFTNARAQSAAVADALADGVTNVAASQNAVFDALASRDTSISGKEPAITAGTTAQFWRGDKTWQAVVQDSISDAVTTIAPSQNAVFDALALKSSTSHTHSSLAASDGTPAQALAVDANGFVGIGTTVPLAQLDVHGTNPGIRFRDTSTALPVNAMGFLEFYTSDGTRVGWMGDGSPTANLVGMAADTGEIRLTTAASQPIRFMTNGSNERMRVDGSGMVGIGTTGPSSLFHVVGDGTTTVATIDRAYPSDANSVRTALILDRSYTAGAGADGIGSALGFKAETETNGTSEFVGSVRAVTTDATAGTVDSYVGIGATANSVTNSDLLVVTGAGNVGVGTTNPLQKLTVDGSFGLLEGGGSPTYHTIFTGGDQTADITYTLPPNAGSNTYVLQTNGSGVLTWVAPTTTTPAFSSIASGTNTSAAMTVGNGASLAPSGTGTVTANQFVGSGSSSNAIDLATAEVAGTLPVARGGTNSGTALNNNRIMVSNGGGIVEAAALTNGQLLVGSTGAAPVAAALTGTANQITVTPGAGSITLSTPQSIHTGASPTFLGLTVSGLTDGVAHVTSGTITGGKVNLASSSDVTGTLAVGSGGTGATSLAGYGALVMNAGGTAATSVAPGASGNVLTSNGTSWTSGAPGSSFSNLSVTGGATFATSSGNVGIGSASPQTKLDVVTTAYGSSATDSTAAILGSVTGPSATNGHFKGVFGKAVGSANGQPQSAYGVTGYASERSANGHVGTAYGTYGTAALDPSGDNNNTMNGYGVYGKATLLGGAAGTANTYQLFGTYGDATSADPGAGWTTTNYGVYGTAANADTNWAGYFVGNVYASGNVGIGTTVPTNTLQVGNTGNTGYGLAVQAGGAGQYGAVIQTTATDTNAALWVRNSSSGASYFRAQNDGNVGINTATPTAKFQVEGGAFVRGGDGDANADGFLVAGDLLTLINYLNAGAGGSLTPLQYSRLDINGDGRVDLTDHAMIIDVINATKTVSQAQTAGKAIANSSWGVDGSGRFGIGTLSPTAKLHVGGTAGVDGIKFPDGTLQTTAAVSTGIRDRARNLKATNGATSATQVTITADELLLQTTGGAAYRATGVNVTATITTSGANGLDTGAEAASTWYHFWVIYDGATVSALLSTSATAPTMPSGYTYKAYVGAVYNNASSNFIAFNQFGDEVAREELNILSGATTTSYTALTLTAAVPTTAKAVIGTGGLTGATGGTNYEGIFLRPTSATTVGQIKLVGYSEVGGGFAADYPKWQFTSMMTSPQTLYYRCYSQRYSSGANNCAAGETTVGVWVSGWKY